MSELEHIRPTGLMNNPAYTHVVTARGARTVYVSGQVAMDAAGDIVGEGDLAAQTEQVMENLGVALSAAGASFEDVVKITTFVVDYQPEHRAVIGAVRGRYFPDGRPPASTLVGIAALAAPGWLIEIEAVAVTD
jgi:enamine deaminase RidA (YjgF/YER057c/UK114 family)